MRLFGCLHPLHPSNFENRRLGQLNSLRGPWEGLKKQ